ncbi:hypothetical protein BH23CHL9_BH23CHL9_03150 [soil metagenome]
MNRRLHPDDPSRLDEVIAQRLRTTAPSAAPQHVLEEALARISQTPQQRGTWLSSRAPRLLAVAAVIALAAVVGLQLPAMLNSIGTDPTPEPSPSFNATPTSTPALTPAGSASVEPSPSPSPAIQTPSAEPAPTADAQSNETLLSFVRRCDVIFGILGPLTTILGDGRVIWPRMTAPAPDGNSVLSVRTLSEDGLARVRDEIASSGLFEDDAVYRHERRADAPEAPGHGLCVYDFSWHGGGGTVQVSANMWFGDEEEETYYEPSPERKTLDTLAQRLADPESWLDPSDWTDPEAAPFEPDSYLVVASVYDGARPEFATLGAPDFDTVSWPFADEPDTFGSEIVGGGRCDVASAADIATLAAELADAGMDQFERPADGPMLTLPWEARGAAVDLQLYPQRPDDEPPCGGSTVIDG